jgi:hypothetical protein
MSSAAQFLPLRGAAAPALAAAAWHVLLLVVYLVPFGGDVSALVCLGREQVGRPPFEAVRVGFEGPGFDGQMYYALARSPWRLHGLPVDCPVYRHDRILYPALAWLLSGGGDPVRLLWALPALNLLAAAGLAWLGARLALHHGRSAWWGFLLPVVANAGMLAMRDLTDPLALFAVCGLLTAWLLRWSPAVVFAWAAAAVLAREQNAAVVLIVVLAALCHRHWRHAAGAAAALLVQAIWVVSLHAAYGAWPFARETVAAPLAGILGHWSLPRAAYSTSYLLLHATGILTLGVQFVLSLAVCFFRVNRSVKLVALAGALLAVVGGPLLYVEEWNYLRVFLWMPLAVWLASVSSGRRWPIVLLSPMALWPLLTIVRAWPK